MIKALRIAAIATPLVLTVGTVGGYFAIASKKTKKHIKSSSQNTEDHFKTEETQGKSSQPKNIYDRFDIFPRLDQHDFYDDIKIIKLKAIIDEEMQAKIINYVIRHMEISEGRISYGMKKINDQNIDFEFEWTSPDNFAHYKTYNFSLENHAQNKI